MAKRSPSQRLRVVIAGKPYYVVYRRMVINHGLCDPPTNEEDRLIRLDNNLKKTEPQHQLLALRIAIHEAYHASDWQKDEQAVNDFATELSDMLWRMGWRRVPELSEIG